LYIVGVNNDDATTCVDDDCPLPEHTGPCPEAATLEMWRAEAKRCRRVIGRLVGRIRYLEETVECYRVMSRKQKGRS